MIRSVHLQRYLRGWNIDLRLVRLLHQEVLHLRADPHLVLPLVPEVLVVLLRPLLQEVLAVLQVLGRHHRAHHHHHFIIILSRCIMLRMM